MKNDNGTVEQQIEQGFVDLYIPAVDCDENPAEINVCASVGEFAGVVLNLTVEATPTQPGRVETAEVTLEDARRLRDALNAAIACLESHPATS